jgi:hypothetical protein
LNPFDLVKKDLDFAETIELFERFLDESEKLCFATSEDWLVCRDLLVEENRHYEIG